MQEVSDRSGDIFHILNKYKNAWMCVSSIHCLSNTSVEPNVYINSLPKKHFSSMRPLNTTVDVDSKICTFQPKQKHIQILLTFNVMCSRAALWHLRQDLYWLARRGQLKVNIFVFYNLQDGVCFPWLIWEGGTESLYVLSEVNNECTYPEGIAHCQHLLYEGCPHWAPFMILMKETKRHLKEQSGP